MAEIRWMRVAIATAIGLIIILAFTFWQAKNNPIIADFDFCAATFAPDGAIEVIKFGDARCPK